MKNPQIIEFFEQKQIVPISVSAGATCSAFITGM